VGVISAPLGTLLDNQHGLFGVLKYAEVGRPFELFFQDELIVTSATWVPALFAFAGVAMSSIQIVSDDILLTDTERQEIKPSWPKVFYGISLFSFQYYLSGVLDKSGVDGLVINAVLATLAVVGFAYFDRTLSGFVLALATAVAGPLAEVFLVNTLQLYTYTHADILGVCSWIPSVYFLGGPAVGNLSRALYQKFLPLPLPTAPAPASETEPEPELKLKTEVEPLDKFRTLMGWLYFGAGIAHFYDILIGDSSLLKAAGLEPFGLSSPPAQLLALLWCFSGPLALALVIAGRRARNSGSLADLGLLQYGIIEVGCAALAGSSETLQSALLVQAAVAASWNYTRTATCLCYKEV